MISLFFYPCQHKLQKLVSRSFYACKEHVIANCSIVGCKSKQAKNSEVTCFNLPKDPQRPKNWLATVSRNKGHLPSNVYCLFQALWRQIFW